jgi:hypothetical protein
LAHSKDPGSTHPQFIPFHEAWPRVPDHHHHRHPERPATDLGYLLQKSPDNAQTFSTSYGTP